MRLSITHIAPFFYFLVLPLVPIKAQDGKLNLHGASVNVRGESKVNVHGDLEVEKEGELSNDNEVRVSKDLKVASKDQGSLGRIEVFGPRDHAAHGPARLVFEDLLLSGNLCFEIWRGASLRDSVRLGNSKFDVRNNTFYIKDPEKGKVQRQGIGSFITRRKGFVERGIKGGKEYSLPLLATAGIRPVSFKGEGKGTFSSNLTQRNDEFTIYPPDKTFCDRFKVDPRRYYRFKKEGEVSGTEVGLSYDSSSFKANEVAEWRSNEWKLASLVREEQAPGGLQELIFDLKIRRQELEDPEEGSDEDPSLGLPRAYALGSVDQKPIRVSADVQPATYDSTSDGTIDLKVDGGVPPYSYSWEQTSSNSDSVGGLSPDIYKVTVGDCFGEKVYPMVAVASEYNRVTFKYSLDGLYGKDAKVSAKEPHKNFGGDASMAVGSEVVENDTFELRSLISTKVLGLDSNRTIVKRAKLHLKGIGHDTGSGKAYLRRAVGSWEERSVNWATRPSSDTLAQVGLESPSTDTQSYTLDITKHMQHMLAYPSLDNGFLLETKMPATPGGLKFGSSEAEAEKELLPDKRLRPVVVIGIVIGDPPADAPPYAKMQRELDGGFYKAQGDSLRFVYRSQYADTDASLSYEIMKDDGTKSGVFFPSKPVAHGDQRYALDMTQMAPGMYLLKVENEKEEERWLRFKVLDYDSSSGHVLPDEEVDYNDLYPSTN